MFKQPVTEAHQGDGSALTTPDRYLADVLARAAAQRANDAAPLARDQWLSGKPTLLNQLQRAAGAFPAAPVPLDVQFHGEIVRDGYRIENISFSTWQAAPGVTLRMMGNVYVPNAAGRHPAVLVVHGHWKGAKQDPVVQSRCQGLVQLGFVVLAVDACGAGERGIGPILGEYHGEMVGAALWPLGISLLGVQVYENKRAIDYLQSRDDVDAQRIGVTGASGGGNQSMYIAAFDDRISCAVPVCSVGNYQAYLGTACCVCETLPGALSFTEEWRVLSLMAPRALMVISATKDARQFSVAEAEKSLKLTAAVFAAFGSADNLRHAVFESGHDYNQPMREAMYGWMRRHLAGIGNGEPVPEPAIELLSPELLRCYSATDRPADFVTLPKFAAAFGRQLREKKFISLPINHVEAWAAESRIRKHRLLTTLIPDDIRQSRDGVVPAAVKVLPAEPLPGEQRNAEPSNAEQPPAKEPPGKTNTQSLAARLIVERFALETEPGVFVRVHVVSPQTSETEPPADPKVSRVAIVASAGSLPSLANDPLLSALLSRSWKVVLLQLRATGSAEPAGIAVARAPDHNAAQWSCWLGYPLLGQWVVDVAAVVSFAISRFSADMDRLTLIGMDGTGPVAIAAAMLDSRIAQTVSLRSLYTLIADEPVVSQRMAYFAPGAVAAAGDIADWVASIAPRRVIIGSAQSAQGVPADINDVQPQYSATDKIFALHAAQRKLSIFAEEKPAELAAILESA